MSSNGFVISGDGWTTSNDLAILSVSRVSFAKEFPRVQSPHGSSPRSVYLLQM